MQKAPSEAIKKSTLEIGKQRAQSTIGHNQRQLQAPAETYGKQARRKDLQTHLMLAQLVKTSANISRPPTMIGATIGALGSKIGAPSIRALGSEMRALGSKIRAPRIGALGSKIGALSRKIGALGSKIGAPRIRALGRKIGALGRKIGALGSKIGAPGIRALGSKIRAPGDVQEKLERMSAKKSPNHWRKEIRQWVCPSTGIACAELVQMMLCEHSRARQCQCLRYHA